MSPIDPGAKRSLILLRNIQVPLFTTRPQVKASSSFTLATETTQFQCHHSTRTPEERGAAGISEATLGRWREEHTELEPRLLEAREQARQKALAGIKAAGEAGDWRALEAFLSLPSPPAAATLPPSFRKSPGQRGGHRPARGSPPRDDASLRPGRLHDDRSTRPM